MESESLNSYQFPSLPISVNIVIAHYNLKGTVCNFLGNLLSKINIFIHKYVLSGVQIPLPNIWLILVNEEFIIFIYMGRVSPRRLPCHSAILKNYNSREGQKVRQRVSTTRFRSEPASRDWSSRTGRAEQWVRGACLNHRRSKPGNFKKLNCNFIFNGGSYVCRATGEEILVAKVPNWTKKETWPQSTKNKSKCQDSFFQVERANEGERFQKRRWSCLLSPRQVSQCFLQSIIHTVVNIVVT